MQINEPNTPYLKRVLTVKRGDSIEVAPLEIPQVLISQMSLFPKWRLFHRQRFLNPLKNSFPSTYLGANFMPSYALFIIQTPHQ